MLNPPRYTHTHAPTSTHPPYPMSIALYYTTHPIPALQNTTNPRNPQKMHKDVIKQHKAVYRSVNHSAKASYAHLAIHIVVQHISYHESIKESGMKFQAPNEAKGESRVGVSTSFTNPCIINVYSLKSSTCLSRLIT